MKRQPHWSYRGKKLRLAVLKRDNYECQIRSPGCTGYATSVDHIHPKAWGGAEHPDNLRAACKPCNLGKGTRSAARVASSSFFSDAGYMRAPLANLSPNGRNAVIRRDYGVKRGAGES